MLNPYNYYIKWVKSITDAFINPHFNLLLWFYIMLVPSWNTERDIKGKYLLSQCALLKYRSEKLACWFFAIKHTSFRQKSHLKGPHTPIEIQIAVLEQGELCSIRHHCPLLLDRWHYGFLSKACLKRKSVATTWHFVLLAESGVRNRGACTLTD